MDALKKKKRTIRGYVTRSQATMEQIVSAQSGSGVLDIEKLSKLEAALDVFRRYAGQFETLVEQILDASDDSDAAAYSALEQQYLDEVAAVNNIGIEYEGKIKSFHSQINSQRARQSIAPSISSVVTSIQPKLKNLQVPRFDGNILNFTNFKGLFDNLIHNNTELTPVIKLHNLKEALKDGDAYLLVRDFPLTEAAYSEAYGAICARFDNKRAIVRALFRQLHNLEGIHTNTKIGSLLDSVDSIIRGLKSAGEKIDDTFSRYVAYMVSLRLDKCTAEDWENSVTSTRSFPLYNEIHKFLQTRMFAAEDKNSDKPKQQQQQPQRATTPKSTIKASYVAAKNTDDRCSVCKKEPHPIYRCDVFQNKTPRERYDTVKQNKLCVLCLRYGHTCSSCPNASTKYKCACGQPHNYLLHFGDVNVGSKQSEEKSSPARTGGEKSSEESTATALDSKQTFSCSSVIDREEVVLLPSALVRFRCGNIVGKARVLLDSCSQPTLVADTFVNKFKISTFRLRSSVKGVAKTAISCCSAVKLSIGSRDNKFTLEIEGDVVPASCLSYTASVRFPTSVIEKLKGLQLAEPSFINSDTCIDSVDIVLGAKYFEKCIMDGSAVIDSLSLRRSKFGWIISGVAPIRSHSSSQFCGLTLNEINDNLVKFWLVEGSDSTSTSMTSEEENCVKHFEDSHSFADDGKFLVRLPLKVDRSNIAPTRKRAENALARVQNKLHGELKKAYSNFMTEYHDLGHMSPVDKQNCGVYYIPHREVLREASSTTPLRVVFNASAKTAGKCSLNEALMVGPTIQRDLFDILISFRLHKFTFVGDIEKMYRMIWVHPSDRELQHILWRSLAADPTQEFQLNTLTYGTSSASFIAQKCLMAVADACQSKLPLVAKIIRENFYMDDVNVGHNDENELISLCQGIRSVLLKHGFNLRKFSSNSFALLNLLAPELRATKNPLTDLAVQGETNILGLCWNPALDNLGIKLCLDKKALETHVSKRIALSVIAAAFDPLGLFAPVLITGKVLLQEFWKEGREWDALASDKLNKRFHDYVKSTESLSDLKIPRQIFEGELDSILAFCDASERAYCAVLYARYLNADNEYCCRFVCSKTRVAPLKELTIPKLELQAAKLLADLAKRVCPNIGVDPTKVLAFSDSTTVLCWLSKPAHNWKTFVRNRVEKIVGIIPFLNWRYVKTYDNPADKATRGLSVTEFRMNLDMWFYGPAFVRGRAGDSFYPIPDLDTHECLEKRKLMNKAFVCASTDSSILERFSSYQRLINTFARVLRVVNFCKYKVREKALCLSVSECEKARKVVIRMYQDLSVDSEIESLKNSEPLKSKGSLIALDPFLDDDHILRVGGRLKNSSLPLEKKHPIIISGQSLFLKLYCRYVHEKYFHAGKKFLLAFLVSEFWIHKGRINLVKAVIHNCVVCRRMKGQVAAQIMGQLPLPRIQIARPFTYVGVDYAGYFECKCTAHRTTRFYKLYAAVFVCLVTRAIHIEVVADLTADALIEAILCMVSRRGIPKVMFSDQGTNMTGAKNLLSLLESEELKAFATRERFDWKMIPPRSPNFGGIWEAGVKSAKWHLATAAKNQALTIVEYRNLFSRIEAILNSRPLCYRTEAEQGSEAITPAHFLVGGSLLTVPVLDLADEISLSRRLRLLQNQTKSFWNVWSRDYLNQMQQRVRWTKRLPNLKEGQIVLVKLDKAKPFQWPLGRIEKTYPDPEGSVRVVEVRLSDGVKKRSISTVIPLLSEEEFNNGVEK